MRAEQKSLTATFDTIDSFIQNNQMEDAIKLLRKAEKKAYDSWSYIGIFKRYNKISETALAEKVLKNALKKNGSNPELLAVYSNFLLRHNKINESLEYSVKLKGTKYGSLYSEGILKKSKQKQFDSDKQKSDFYKDLQFYEIYFDAYTSSRNPVWLRNCALFNLASGLYGNAAALDAGYYSDADDAYFWSLVLYDSGKFYNSVIAADSAKKFLLDYQDKGLFKVSPVKISAIQSDAYMAISEMEKAEAARQEVITNLDNLFLRKSDEELLPVIMQNSAVYAVNQGNDDASADLLFYIVNRWNNYVPGLILYADFAYRSNLEREEDSETLALRKAGISTLDMEKYDSRRKIPLSDALYRIDSSLKNLKDPYLSIAKIDLTYKTNPDLNEKEKNRDLWRLLEDNYSEEEKYKALLVQYAIHYLLTTKQYEDAWSLFIKYSIEKLNLDEKRDFWEQFQENMKFIDLPIVEIGGWFAANAKNAEVSKRIFEYCVYESSGILEDGLISPYVSTSACMNLADIYFSTGFKEKALDLYGKVAGRESKNAVRSEIFYRIACVYVAMGDTKNALRSADYSYSIYPENIRASILKQKLQWS